PAPALRRRGSGGDRLARDRARDDQGEAQGRAREVLRRRHLAQAEAARAPEGGQEADEAGRRRRGPPGGVLGGAQPGRGGEALMALEMRPACERCGASLAADGEAFICSFECTFCATCTDGLARTCPNCGGEL